MGTGPSSRSLEDELEDLEPWEESGVGEDAGVKHGHRLHPLSPLFEIGRSFVVLVVPGLLVLVLATGDRYPVWYMLLFVPSVARSVFRYVTRRYVLTAGHLVIQDGLLFKKTRHIPFARIQNVDTVQNPLHRLFGVVEVRIETASGQEPEAVLRVLSLASLEEIRSGVMMGRGSSALDEGLEAAPERAGDGAFFRMRPLDVAYFGLLSQRGVALLLGLVYLVWELDLWDRAITELDVDPEELSRGLSLLGGIATGTAIFLVLQALTVFWAFVTLHDFHIARKGEDLRTTCGLWTRQTATLPRHRIQFLQVRAGWMMRRFGRISVKALSAGGDSTDDSQVSRKWLVPLVDASALPGILREVQPEASFEHLEWMRPHPRAVRRLFLRWLILLALPSALVARNADWWAVPIAIFALVLAFLCARARARRLAYATDDRAVYMRDGIHTHVSNAVRYSKIQSIALTRTPFDRRLGMATVRVDTAGGTEGRMSFVVPYLPVRAAARLVRQLRERAAATSFRW